MNDARRAEREWIDALDRRNRRAQHIAALRRAAAQIDEEGANVGAEDDADDLAPARGICVAVGIGVALVAVAIALVALLGWRL